MSETVTLALLAVAGLAAGWVDAVVGGGGLIQLPSLLIAYPNAAPEQLLATNKVASVWGTATSAVTYARRLRPDLRTAAGMAVAAFVGAMGGAALAGFMPVGLFRPLVLVLLVVVAAVVWLRPDLGSVHAPRRTGRRHSVIAVLVGVGIGFYDGIFGPGTGTFLVFALVGLLGYAFLQASAVARIVNTATNLGALVVFVPQGAPLWRAGLVMAAANLVGGYLGARTAVAAGNRFVRVVYLLVVAALVLRLGWDVVS